MKNEKIDRLSGDVLKLLKLTDRLFGERERPMDVGVGNLVQIIHGNVKEWFE